MLQDLTFTSILLGAWVDAFIHVSGPCEKLFSIRSTSGSVSRIVTYRDVARRPRQLERPLFTRALASSQQAVSYCAVAACFYALARFMIAF